MYDTYEERVGRLESAYEHMATKADIANVHAAIAELRTSIAESRGEMVERITASENRHIRWTVGTILAGISIMVAIIKLI